MVISNPSGARFRTNFSIASGSVSQMRSRSMPSAARNPNAWNSAWLPVPIIAIVVESARASSVATIADVAAVRSAVSRVISARSVG
jgi:hypothetical protein